MFWLFHPKEWLARRAFSRRFSRWETFQPVLGIESADDKLIPETREAKKQKNFIEKLLVQNEVFLPSEGPDEGFGLDLLALENANDRFREALCCFLDHSARWNREQLVHHFSLEASGYITMCDGFMLFEEKLNGKRPFSFDEWGDLLYILDIPGYKPGNEFPSYFAYKGVKVTYEQYLLWEAVYGPDGSFGSSRGSEIESADDQEDGENLDPSVAHIFNEYFATYYKEFNPAKPNEIEKYPEAEEAEEQKQTMKEMLMGQVWTFEQHKNPGINLETLEVIKPKFLILLQAFLTKSTQWNRRKLAWKFYDDRPLSDEDNREFEDMLQGIRPLRFVDWQCLFEILGMPARVTGFFPSWLICNGIRFSYLQYDWWHILHTNDDPLRQALYEDLKMEAREKLDPAVAGLLDRYFEKNYPGILPFRAPWSPHIK